MQRRLPMLSTTAVKLSRAKRKSYKSKQVHLSISFCTWRQLFFKQMRRATGKKQKRYACYAACFRQRWQDTISKRVGVQQTRRPIPYTSFILKSLPERKRYQLQREMKCT